jgi:hypothetical protein
MHPDTILHLLIALAYALSGRGAGRRRQHETAVEAFSLAMLYANLTMIHLPLIDVLLLVQSVFTGMA